MPAYDEATIYHRGNKPDLYWKNVRTIARIQVDENGNSIEGEPQ